MSLRVLQRFLPAWMDRLEPLAVERFNFALQQRVRLFQREQELADDGVVGLQTLLRLNAELGSRRLRCRGKGVAAIETSRGRLPVKPGVAIRRLPACL